MAIYKPNILINNLLFLKEAKKLGLSATFFKELECVQIYIGGKYYYFRGPTLPFARYSDYCIGGNKYLMNRILSDAGIPVAKSICISKQQFNTFDWKLEELKFPLVAKPTIGTWGGEGVLCNIQNMQVLHKHLTDIFKENNYASIEEYHGGLNSYRVYVFDNKVLGVLQRLPPMVTGDGKHNIHQLMAIENKKRQKYKGKLPFAPLKVDHEYQLRLDELGLTVEDIPEKGKIIELCYRTNSLAGGSTIALKRSSICSENVQFVLNVAKVLHVKLVGLDVACEDISKPIGPLEGKSPNQIKGIIIEANMSSDLTLHETPMIGPPTHIAHYILKKIIKKHPLAYFFTQAKRFFGLRN